MASNSIYFIFLITISVFTSKTVGSTELITSVQRPIIVTHGYPTMIKSLQADSDESDGRFCQIEYQITRKRAGKCVKVRDGVIGCVSGDYMNPFHPDCF
ncbi:uncharacterized protein LOC108629421 [Ceratina calcarata]|uniref:Uncharacterized protein LOC108629421 n=1 Tax=Ceratina calcarata TaxID=156304 RepID=A0AAJ7NBV6_9HYME|nr:uncharacterized protein LOC108629421 [Ceratina calcarata]